MNVLTQDKHILQLIATYFDFVSLAKFEQVSRQCAKIAKVNWLLLYFNTYKHSILYMYQTCHQQAYKNLYKLQIEEIQQPQQQSQVFLNRNVNRFAIPFPRHAKQACECLFMTSKKWTRIRQMPGIFFETVNAFAEHGLYIATSANNVISITEMSTCMVVHNFSTCGHVHGLSLIHRPDVQQTCQGAACYTILAASAGIVEEHLVVDNMKTVTSTLVKSVPVQICHATMFAVEGYFHNQNLYMLIVDSSKNICLYQDGTFLFCFSFDGACILDKPNPGLPNTYTHALGRFFVYTDTMQQVHVVLNMLKVSHRFIVDIQSKQVKVLENSTVDKLSAAPLWLSRRGVNQFLYTSNLLSKRRAHYLTMGQEHSVQLPQNIWNHSASTDNHVYIVSSSIFASYLMIDDTKVVDLAVYRTGAFPVSFPGEWFIIVEGYMHY